MKTKQNGIFLFGISLADLLLNYLMIIIFLFILVSILPKLESDSKESNVYMGTLCVELSWPNTENVDLDLWGQSPVDPRGVGYHNPHSTNLDLYRDVLGFTDNPTHNNVEVMCAKQLVKGIWTFNVSYFADYRKTGNHDIDATIMVILSKTNEPKRFYTAKYLSHFEGEEKTLMAFRIDENLNIVENSINSLNVHLRDITPAAKHDGITP